MSAPKLVSTVPIAQSADKILDVLDEIIEDIHSSPRSRLASKLDACVGNTQILMTSLKSDIKKREEDTRERAEAMGTLVASIRLLSKVVFEMNSKIDDLWSHFQEEKKKAEMEA
jgi:hypothetical protein